jgi:GT2 family glycosyltransferase
MNGAGTLGAVVIGRNEGARLVRCLASLKGEVAPLVYVDSGSTDGSIYAAQDAGAKVIQLDNTVPFTAARARAAGFEALTKSGLPDYVQFIDGDCGIEPGWIAAGRAALADYPDLGLVTGWRSEINREASVYNALCDFEWHRPAGDIASCGGDMMVRSAAYEAAGGFNPAVIAAEDDEFCIRLAKAGWRLHRLPLKMTRHDAAMTRFSQWWKRAVRTGHGFAQVGFLHPDYFVRERRRAWLFAVVLPVAAFIGAAFSPWALVAVLALYLASYLRTAQGLVREGLTVREAAHHALFLTLSKFPNLLGMITFHLRRLRGADMRIIEYK